MNGRMTPGLQELEILVHVFCATNNIIVHLTYHAPQIVAHARVFTNVYLIVNLLER